MVIKVVCSKWSLLAERRGEKEGDLLEPDLQVIVLPAETEAGLSKERVLTGPGCYTVDLAQVVVLRVRLVLDLLWTCKNSLF